MIDDKTELSLALSEKLDEFLYSIGTNDNCQSVHDVIKANILSNQELGHSIDLLNSTFATQSDSLFKYLFPLLSVIIGVVLGFLSNRLHWAYTEKKKKESESFEKISTLISDIETLSVEYWIKNYNDDDTKNEVYIKSKIRLLSKYIRNFKTSNIKIKEELDRFESEIFDVITGDDFESSKRKASKSKAITISRKCADINAFLLTDT